MRVVKIKLNYSKTQIIAEVEERGRIYACGYSPDTEVTIAMVKKDWKEDRRAFRPYNQSTATFL